MRRASNNSLFFLIAGLMLAVSLIPASVASAQPTLEVVWPTNGLTILAAGSGVKVEVEGFTLDCSAIGQPPFPGRGHYHVIVDGILDKEGCETRANLTSNLTPGARTITVELVENNHTALNPPVKTSISVTAEADGSVTYVPSSFVTGAARTAGAIGSFFKSTLWAVAAAGESKIRMQFIPALGQPEADFPVVGMTVGNLRSVVFPDVLRDAFGVTGGTSGNIVVSVAAGSATPKIAARTFNDQSEAGNGTFGQFIPAIMLADVTNPGTVQIDGLAANSAFRSNVGVINLDLNAPLSATIEIFDRDGVRQGDAIPVSVPPGSLVQTNGVASGLSLQPFSVKVMSAGKFSAYASKLDNITSDPIFIMDSPTTETEQAIDGVGSLAGGGTTFFKSELSLTNRRTLSSALVELSFIPRGSTTPLEIVDVTIPAGGSRFYTDAVEELFELGGVAGAILIESSVPITAWARTYNDLAEGDGEGTFGQFIPAFGATDLIGLSGAILPGLSENTAIRTNAGLVNVGFSSASATLSVWSAEGVKLGERAYTVAPGGALFIGRVVIDIGVSSLSDGYIKVIPSTGNALYAWASSVDNVSTDQTFFRPFKLD